MKTFHDLGISPHNIETIQKKVADHFQIRHSDMTSKRRPNNIAIPRQIAMYLCRKHLGASFPEIGQQFGGKDHSTVVHAVNKIERCLGEDLALQRQMTQLEQRLNLHHLSTQKLGIN